MLVQPAPTATPFWSTSSWKGDTWKVMQPDSVRPFNNTDGSPCPWDLDPSSNACYDQTRLDADLELSYVLPHMHEILAGDIAWSPSLWIGPETISLSHQFTVFIPSSRRFAVGTLSLAISDTGGIVKTKNFLTHEPFLLDVSFWDFCIEMCFYVIIVYMFFSELFEIWDCMCQSELMIPLQIVARSLYLSALEIHYFHEKSAEVYDPRNPNTGKPFVFPDLEDMANHLESSIKPKKATKLKLDAKMDMLKVKMAKEPERAQSSKEYVAYHDQMRDMHVECIALEQELQDEIQVAETASTLQLAVMWLNKWSDDFEPGYLATLSNDDGVREDEFKDVDWIQVSRDYLTWGKTYVDNVEHLEGDFLASMASAATGAIMDTAMNLSRIFSDDKNRRSKETAQEQLFADISPFTDYLDVIRDTIKLHDRMMIARNIQHWNGPHGVDLSNTIERSYQQAIKVRIPASRYVAPHTCPLALPCPAHSLLDALLSS